VFVLSAHQAVLCWLVQDYTYGFVQYGSDEPCRGGGCDGACQAVQSCMLMLQVMDVRFIDRGRRVLVATPHGVEVSWPRPST
jgi:hypothetical protein